MIGLVLQGGGARGSYHVGAVEALLKNNIKFDVVVGTSIGAINGALIASNEFHLLKKLWKELDSQIIFNTQNVSTFNWDTIKKDFNDLKKFIDNKGMDITNFKELLYRNINEEKLRASNIDFGLTTYNLTDKLPIEIFKNDIPKGKLIEYIIASSYLPVFKFEKIIDDKYYIDGGAFNNCPISMLDTNKFEKIYVIKIYKNEFVDEHLQKENIILISPNQNLGNLINFNKKNTEENMKLGYYDTLKILKNLDGNKYYIKYKPKTYYSKLFDEKIKDKILFELKIYEKTNEKKLILKILESLAIKYKIERFKIYSVKSLILILKLKMSKEKNDVYYDFIKNINII